MSQEDIEMGSTTTETAMLSPSDSTTSSLSTDSRQPLQSSPTHSQSKHCFCIETLLLNNNHKDSVMQPYIGLTALQWLPITKNFIVCLFNYYRLGEDTICVSLGGKSKANGCKY